MSKRLSIAERLRVERAVWTVDAYVQSLPSRARRAIRRELRANLRASAAEVGARTAIRNLGSLRRLAVGYLEAEYGEGRPRPQLLKGIAWGSVASLVLLVALIVGYESFLAGLDASTSAPGTYRWEVARVLGVAGEVTVDDTGFAEYRLAFSYPYFLYPIVVGLIGARIWRLWPVWWRRVVRDRALRRASAHP